jgi:hypothetical protein
MANVVIDKNQSEFGNAQRDGFAPIAGRAYAVSPLTSEAMESYAGVLGDTTVTATTNVDGFSLGNDDDTVVVTSTLQIQATDKFDGGSDTDTIQIGTSGAGVSVDLSGVTTDATHGFLNMEALRFVNTSGTSTVTLSSAQFGSGKISNSLDVVGNGQNQAIVVNVVSGATFSASNWDFNNFTSGTDTITINGAAGDETITGSSLTDTISGGAGADAITGGEGGDTLTGGSGVDTFSFSGGDTSLTFGGSTMTAAGGTVVGYDKITDFTADATAAGSEKLEFGFFGANIANNTGGGVSGDASDRRLHTGFTVKSHSITGGIITFSDSTSFSAVGLTSAGDVAAVAEYLRFTDIGQNSPTVAFTATFDGVTHTYVWRQSGNSASSNSNLIDLQNVKATGLSNSFGEISVLDGAAPTAVATVTALSADTGTAGDFITKTAAQTVSGTYTGTLDSTESIQVSLDGGNWTTATAASNAWSASVTLQSGTHTLFVRTVDNAGNVTSGTGHSYTLDTTSPTVASVALSDAALKAGETSTVTVTFSEKVTGFSNDDVTAPSGDLSTFSTSDGGLTWTATFTPTVDIENPTNAVTVTGNYTDLAGNAGSGATSDNYAVDTKAPDAASVSVDPLIDGTEVTAVSFTVSGLEPYGSAVVHFTNGGGDHIDVTVSANGTYSDLDGVDLSSLGEGPITTGIDVADAAGNAGPTAAGNGALIATGTSVTLSVAQISALGAGQLSSYIDGVIVADSVANISPALSGLAAKGATQIHLTAGSLFLTKGEYLSLVADSITFVAGDPVYVRDTGTNLASFTELEIGALAANGIRALVDPDRLLSLTVGQFRSLNGVYVSPAYSAIIADTATNLGDLDPAEISSLYGDFGSMHSTSGVLALRVDQYRALGGIKLLAGDDVKIYDTGANIASMTPLELVYLAGRHVDAIDASDDTLALTVAQYRKLGAVALTDGDTVTLTDTGANLASLSQSELAGLTAKHIDALDATNNALTLSAAQFANLGAVGLASNDVVLVKDTGAALGGLDIAAVAAKGVDRLDATDNTLALSVAQYSALGGVALTAADVVTIADTGANLATLDFGSLAGKLVDRLDATNDTLALSLSQFNALGKVLLAADDAVTVTGVAAANDVISFKTQTFTSNDSVVGDTGVDTLGLIGDYASDDGLTFGATDCRASSASALAPATATT